MATFFSGAAIVEAADADKLEELLSLGMKDYVVQRLGPSAVQIDHARLDDVRKLLKRLGQTPRITTE